MAPEQRVNFNAPEELVDRADELAAIIGTNRTELLVTGLRSVMDELLEEPTVRRQLERAYFAGDIDRQQLTSLLGEQEASRLAVLRDSLDREIPPPADTDLPADEEFYEAGEPASWEPEDDPDEELIEAALTDET